MGSGFSVYKKGMQTTLNVVMTNKIEAVSDAKAYGLHFDTVSYFILKEPPNSLVR